MTKGVTLLLLISNVCIISCRREEISLLEKLLPLYRSIKNYYTDIFIADDRNGRNAKYLISNAKLQRGLAPSKFPCDLTVKSRSDEVPTSVHKLRPGDIDVVAAIGDSLTAGFGATATDIVHVLYENRGRSFAIGGEETWRTYLTLPNILKVFNPNLKGYSLNSLSTDRKSWLNVAEAGAVSKNMPYMARTLIQRIKSDRSIDIQKDWKIITFMIGDNDFCSEICYFDDYEIVVKKHKQDILEVLRIFRHNLPRTIVNLIPPPHLKVLTEMYDKTLICHIVHLLLCPCIVGKANEHKRQAMFRLMKRWQMLDLEIANLPEFDKDDFTVIPHTYTLNYTFPRTQTGSVDYSYLSEDCFHFSQKAHARFANDLWNSLLDPMGYKRTDGLKEFTRFTCPSSDFPYIYTRRNSYVVNKFN